MCIRDSVPQDGHNRWYTGGGIYRPVHLLVGEDAYMQRYGVRVITLSVAPACVRVEVMTHGGDCAEVRIAEKNGKEVVCTKAAVADGHAVVELEIPDAKLWNAEHPNLYLAEVTLYSGGKAVDTVTESFGLRVIEIDPVAVGLHEILLRHAPAQRYRGEEGSVALLEELRRHIVTGGEFEIVAVVVGAVSYTHLTLPTIYSV